MFDFELKYHFSQITFKIAAVLFFILGILSTKASFGSDELHKNAPYVISTLVALLSLFSIFVSTLCCANVVLRDSTYKMDALLYTTGIKRLPYFFIRFAGLFTAVFLVLCLAVFGIFVAALFQHPEQLGPFKLVYFVQPLFVFGLPTIVFVSSLIFTAAILTRSVKIVYVSGVLLYVLYLLASILGNSPLIATSALKVSTPDLLTVLADPFGLAPFFGETRSWSTAQRNEQLFTFQGDFLWNRIAWFGFSLLLLGISYRFFNFRAATVLSLQRKNEPGSTIHHKEYRRYKVLPTGIKYHWACFRKQLKLEIAAVFNHVPFYLMLLIWAFLMTIELKDHLFSGSYDINSYPATEVIMSQLLSIRPAMLLIIFYAAEIICRERTVNIQSLVYSTPAANLIFWASKALTLGCMIAMLITLNIAIGIGTQLFNQHDLIDLITYLSLYYYTGLPLCLFALLVISIQTLIPNKYLGMMINLFIAGLISFSRNIGIEHYLLRYASVPRLEFSHLNGFGHYTHAFNWYMLYWVAFAGMLTMISIQLWQSSRQDHFYDRLKALSSQWTKAGQMFFLLCMLLWIGTGIYIYHQSNIIGKYKSSAAQLDWQLRYEQKYKALKHLPQPIIKSVKTSVALFPELHKYQVRGRYLLKNESDKSIESIWVAIHQEVSKSSISISGSEKQIHNLEFDQYQIPLKQALLPGDTLSMQFSMDVVRSGFMPFNNEHTIVKNGSYLELEKYLPAIGYHAENESDDPIARKEAGLSEKPEPGISDNQYHLIDYDAIISTVPDQYIVTVGTLERSWIANNRRYFHYKTPKPISFMLALSAAKYLQRKAKYRDISLTVFYQQGHEYNVNAVLQGMKDALHYGEQNFSPYPLKQLVLAEIPQYRGAATAYPGVLFGSENIVFLSDFRDSTKINHAYAIAAHETAHQWWANQLSPDYAPGAAFLTESLAKYTEAMVIEQQFGKGYLSPYLKADNMIYFNLRNMYPKELPLASTSDQPFVHYQKGGLSLYAIAEAIGQDKLNAALRRILGKYGAATGTKPLSEALIQELYIGTSASQRRLIDDGLRKVATYSIKTKVISNKLLKSGQYQLLVSIHINKNELKDAVSKPILLNEDFDIAVFDQQGSSWNQRPRPFYLKKHHFNQSETLLSIVLDRKPGAVGIDPFGYVLDENLIDNIQTVP